MGTKDIVWVVVRVWRGIPDGVELYPSEEMARNREREIGRDLPMEDAVGVFEVTLPNLETEQEQK